MWEAIYLAASPFGSIAALRYRGLVVWLASELSAPPVRRVTSMHERAAYSGHVQFSTHLGGSFIGCYRFRADNLHPLVATSSFTHPCQQPRLGSKDSTKSLRSLQHWHPHTPARRTAHLEPPDTHIKPLETDRGIDVAHHPALWKYTSPLHAIIAPPANTHPSRSLSPSASSPDTSVRPLIRISSTFTESTRYTTPSPSDPCPFVPPPTLLPFLPRPR
jgi:hypothetical protein